MSIRDVRGLHVRVTPGPLVRSYRPLGREGCRVSRVDRKGRFGTDLSDAGRSLRPADVICDCDQVPGMGELECRVPKRAVDSVLGSRDE